MTFRLGCLTFFSTLIFSVSAFAGPAVLVEEIPPKSSKPIEKRYQYQEIKPLSQRTTLKQTYVGQEFDSTAEMRKHRRVGVGLLTAGQLGLGGAMVELNLNYNNSFITGFGGGPKYNTFLFQYKRILGGEVITPYLTLGVSHWSGGGRNGSLQTSTPSMLSSRLLSDEERATGKFAKDFVIPSLGLQYNQLVGDYVGLGLFAEVMGFIDPSNPAFVPTGSFGIVYYF